MLTNHASPLSIYLRLSGAIVSPRPDLVCDRGHSRRVAGHLDCEGTGALVADCARQCDGPFERLHSYVRTLELAVQREREPHLDLKRSIVDGLGQCAVGPRR